MRVRGARIACAPVAAALAMFACALFTGSPAAGSGLRAQPATPSTAADPKAGTPVCRITDRNVVEASGIAVTGDAVYIVNDSTNVGSQERVFKFTPECEPARASMSYPGAGPLDPEDLAVGADGTLWIADIGDNDLERPTVALWKLTDDKIEGPFRMSYPDGKHDAEALLIGADGLPIIVTKAVKEPKTLIYVPTGPLQEGSTTGVPLKQVGQITLPRTTTANLFGPAGRTAVTGAAISADRGKVVLRTYADAFEWTVAGGDIVKALTTGKPLVTPLPNELMGEAVSYSPDGKSFWTISETSHLDSDDPKRRPEILSYTPNTEPLKSPSSPAGPKAPAEKAWWSSLLSSTDRLYTLIGAIGLLGALLVAAGVVGILRSRRRPAEPDDDHDFDPRPRGGPPPDNSMTTVLTPAGAGYGGYDDGYGYQQGYGQPGYQGGAYHQPNYGYDQGPYQEPYPPQPQYGQPGYNHPDQGYHDPGYNGQGYHGQQYR